MSNPTWLWATIGGTTYDLTSAGILWFEQADGLGLPPMHRFTQRGPQQHGETNRDFRLDPRQITLIGSFARPTEAELYTARRRLLDIFAPSNSPIVLRWDLSNGAVRQIDTFYSGGLSLPIGTPPDSSGDRSGQTRLYSQGIFQRSAIELTAYDPTFYDPTLLTATLTHTTFGGGFVVPMPVPFSVGGSTLGTTLQVTYSGDWLSYPVIRLTGPLDDPVLTNTTTGDVLNFTGASISAGDYWDIDLSYGAKTVIDAAGDSQIAFLTATSDLATFSLAPALDGSASRVNTLTLSATGATSVSAARLQWYSRFVGM